MTTVTLEEAQAKLPELIDGLAVGGELVITRNAFPVAKLVPPSSGLPQPVFGRGHGKVFIISDDDEHLDAFKEYMP